MRDVCAKEMDTRGPIPSLPSYQWSSFSPLEKNLTRPTLSPITSRLQRVSGREGGREREVRWENRKGGQKGW